MKSSMKSNKSFHTDPKKNTLEKLNEYSGDSKTDNVFDTLLGRTSEKRGPSFGRQRSEFTIFSHQTYTEKELIPREIEHLKTEIRQEIEVIKKTNKSLITEVEGIEKATLETQPQKAGIYQIRFLEFLLSLLQNFRAKVTEAKSWLSAMQTKRKKRGSLFAARSKSKGTQYSMSQELQNTRSIQ